MSTPETILRCSAVLDGKKATITKDLTNELKAARIELDQLKSSSSWKLTAPLRWLGERTKNL